MRSYRRAAHAVYECHYHFVFITRYRKPVLKGEIALAMRDLTRQVCHAHDIEILAGTYGPTTSTCC
jgi:putative transposase